MISDCSPDPYSVLATIEHQICQMRQTSASTSFSSKALLTSHESTRPILHEDSLVIIPGRGRHIHDDIVQRCRLGDLPMQTRGGRGRRHCRQVDTDVANRSVKVVLRVLCSDQYHRPFKT